jgi:hypothetical protein
MGTATAGACATIVSDALMNPFDGKMPNDYIQTHSRANGTPVIKQRMQVHGSTYRTITACASDVFRKEGLVAFYVSYPTTLSMTIPFTATQFAAYDSISKIMNPGKEYNPVTHITAGGLAGAFAAAVTTPLDVIKTLLQTRGTSEDARIRNCKGLWEAGRIIRDTNGLGGFWRGLGPRIVTTMPSTAICWGSYEMAK